MNGSGKILALCCLIGMTLSLSVNAQQRGGGGDRPERPKFSSLDLDSDGSLTFEEFEQSEIPNNDHATIFGHIDADGDGVITEDEFTNHKPPQRRER